MDNAHLTRKQQEFLVLSSTIKKNMMFGLLIGKLQNILATNLLIVLPKTYKLY